VAADPIVVKPLKTARRVQRKAWWRQLPLHSDLLLVALVVAVIALMVLPLPPFMLDTLIALNLTISVVLLMVSLYIRSPLGLSTFPSLLLFTTLFRLALNIASTRQILLNAYAGDIILTFGKLVVGGDVIVGAVVFLIIAVVQFIVIAKGSERVAEVGARFSLDAMPGKQMSIDADLRAGIIDKDEAKRRRASLENESQLYGAMDGAMKFVKGDAIAGILIAVVNIVAGVAIGVLRKGMSAGEALDVYSVLTVGDALVSQIPSLFVSIASGVIITRVSDPERSGNANLGNEIAQQIRAQPKALLVGGLVITALLLVPGFPKLQFLVLGGAVAGAGWYLMRGYRRYQRPGDVPMPVLQREGTSAVPLLLDRREHAMTVPLALHVSEAFERSISMPRLQHEFEQMRVQLGRELGLPFPGLVIRTRAALGPREYTLHVNEIPVARGELAAGAQAEPALAQHLLRTVRRHADEFMGLQETQMLLVRLAEVHPDLDRELQRGVTLPRINEVLRRLVREGIGVRNLRDIAHALIDWAPKEKDTVMLTEYVRSALASYVSHRHADADHNLKALVLHPALEQQLQASRRQTPAGTILMLDPAVGRRITQRIKEASLQPDAAGAVLLTSLELRPYVRRFIEQELPEMAVLSYQELASDLRVNTVASIQV
jgi:type III secretion protein V